MVDLLNHRIQVFTAGGKYLRMFERHGWRMGLSYPTGVAIDTSMSVRGAIIVSLCSPQRVSLWKEGGGTRRVSVSLWTSCG
jgi:hypothetical protein